MLTHNSHRSFYRLAALILLMTATLTSRALADDSMMIHKNPSCGCCGKWVQHLEDNGFSTSVKDESDMNAIKAQLGIASQYQSCHTGTQGGYVFEGHIPAATIKRFLAAPPEGAIGLAVPGMPVGSPGMEMGDQHQDYYVLLLKADGTAGIYEEIRN